MKGCQFVKKGSVRFLRECDDKMVAGESPLRLGSSKLVQTWVPHIKENCKKTQSQKKANGLYLVQFDGHLHQNPSVSSNFEVERIPLSHYILALWGNKIVLPIMKVKKFEKFIHKLGLGGCIWSSLMAPGIKTLMSHPILELEEFPFLIIVPLG